MTATDLDQSPLAAIDDASVWLNSEPLTSAALRGHVVMVDFWTYSCVNWLRTLPYVRAWHERFRHRGLVVLGVHAPEFGFEHDLDNVRRATGELNVSYPVVIDNDFTIWRSFQNHYWPAIYLLDGAGRVRFHHFGEEAYPEIERTSQRLLGVHEDLVRVEAGGLSEAADWRSLRSQETYLGLTRGERRVDSPAEGLALHQWTLSGDWSIGEEAAALHAISGSISYSFEARDLNMVLAPPASGGPVRFDVRLNGRPPGDDHGMDIDASGSGVVEAPRMYQLVRLRTPIRRQTFEIAFHETGVRAYVVTFG